MRKLLALLCLVPMLAVAQSYTTFPNLRSGNMDFTATIRANGSACPSGAAVVSGSGSVSCVVVIPASEKGANSGVATLDSGGKVPTAQLPFSGLTYDGSWNANTNSPTLADGVGTSGHFYITSVAGSQNLGSGSISFAVGDWALYNGTVWQKVPSSAAVTSVFSRTGAVTATAGDYTATQVTNTPAGGISATTAQAAINELDTEKQAAASTLTSWAALTRASGFDTFTQTPSSANLRGLLTDETGTGLAYFQGGALGTPASGTLTSATGLPWSTGLTGVPTTAVGYGITGGAKLDAYAGGDTPSAFTLGIVDSADAATWRAALGAGTSSFNGDASTLTGTLADARLSSNVPLKNAANTFTSQQTISAATNPYLKLTASGVGEDHYLQVASNILNLYAPAGRGWQLSANAGAQNMAMSSSGNVTINAPTSGNTLTVNNVAGSAGVVVTDGTVGSYVGRTLTNNSVVFGPYTNHSLQLYTNDTQRFVITNGGNTTINAPNAGVALNVSGITGTLAQTITSSGASTLGFGWNVGLIGSAWNILTQSTDPLAIGTAGAAPLSFWSGGASRISLASAGNVTVNAPSSATAFTVNGVADGGGGTAWTSEFIGASSSGHSLGLRVRAGTTSGDSALRVMDASNSNMYFDIAGNGGVQVGAPTGGNPGVGGINVDGVLQKDGVNVCLGDGTNCLGGGGVTSITGTSNQVIASASTGAVTLSTPQSIGTSSSVQFGSFGVGTASSGTSGEIRATNNVTAYYSSDRRLKENVQAIPDALSKVEAIRGVTFDWTPEYIALHGGEDGYFVRKHDVGVIAQEVESVLPEVVATQDTGYKAVKYDRLVPLLIEAIKDLKAQNDELYERVKKLEGTR